MPENSETPISDAELAAEWARKRDAAAAEHAPIADDIRHRRAMEEISKSMRPLTPEQLQRREEEVRQREATRESERRYQRWCAFVSERGERYQGCRLATFELDADPAIRVRQESVLAMLRGYCERIDRNIGDGVGVVLFGPKGTGKDHLAVALTHAAIRAGRSVHWLNGQDMFGDIRDGMDKGEAERAFINRLKQPDVLYLSDPLPPHGKLSDFQMGMLFRALDARYSRRKPCWVTVNVTDGVELDQRLGAQNADRLRDDALAIYCNWASHRKAIQ